MRISDWSSDVCSSDLTLSKNAFNALLKTLEEPPPHVKFLLATTDPQKLPVTVLSRCLKFNLKRLLPEQIRSDERRVGKSMSVRVDIGGRRTIKKKYKNN